MQIGVIVQARMSSNRYPGKTLYEVGGKPLLEYLLERLVRCQYVNQIVVATSIEAGDDSIKAFCQKKGINCYRGPLLDVAGRFKKVVEKYQFDGFVRICGDSPLLDPYLVDRLVKIFRDGDFDLVTNIQKRTFPKGQSVEVLRSESFMEAVELINEECEREHITRYFYEKPDSFRIFNVSSEINYGSLQLSVDTEEDMERFASIVTRMDKPHWEYGLTEILKLYFAEGTEIQIS